jgi:hypothetical protein
MRTIGTISEPRGASGKFIPLGPFYAVWADFVRQEFRELLPVHSRIRHRLEPPPLEDLRKLME